MIKIAKYFVFFIALIFASKALAVETRTIQCTISDKHPYIWVTLLIGDTYPIAGTAEIIQGSNKMYGALALSPTAYTIAIPTLKKFLIIQRSSGVAAYYVLNKAENDIDRATQDFLCVLRPTPNM